MKRVFSELIGLMAILSILSCAKGSDQSAQNISGSWSGADWGNVVIKDNVAGSYTSTFNGQLGSFELQKITEQTYKGKWGESDGKRYGIFSLGVSKAGQTIAVTWDALDDSNRPRSGKSTWRRKR